MHCQLFNAITEKFPKTSCMIYESYGLNDMWRFGLNFINVLLTAFTLEEPKSVKKESQVISLFTLLGSTSVKADCKCVDEIDTRF
jgi:hypothetical protein